MVTVIGSYLSPYVRKVLAVLHRKGIAYEIDPITPFMGDDRFSQLSPLRRIPVLIDGDTVLADSSVICEYLEERTPEPATYPRGLVERARARWLEEYADSRMADVCIWQYWYPLVVNRFVFGVAPDPAAIEKTVSTEIPEMLSYLERELPASGFLFGAAPCVPDFTIAAVFRNLELARYRLDAARWAKTAAYLARAAARDELACLRPFEESMLRTPPAQHRKVLAELGAPLSRESYDTGVPRPGIMRL
ncbi:MAG TPA: glutathione S-transferase family protein [Myxococcota bacterium]|nr:glutathione S-transferase family protein [Myxococcota bacterium]